MFRAAFIAVFTALSLMRGYFKVRHRAFRFTPISREEGVVPGLIRAVLGTVLIAATAAYCFQPRWGRWMYLPLHEAVRAAGILGCAAAVALLGWVHVNLGAHFTTSVSPNAASREPVTTGPYRHVRHPMYSAYLILFCSAGLVSANWLIGACGIGIILTLTTLRVPREEQELLRACGETYTRYMRRTPRFVPRLERREWTTSVGRDRSGFD